MRGKVQEIIDTFNLLSPENKGTLFEFAYNALKAADSAKKTNGCAPVSEEKMLEKKGSDYAYTQN